MPSQVQSYPGYRFPSEIISHAVWLYHRFALSFRDVEDLLAQRSITVALVRECCSSGTHCRYSWRSDARTNTIFGMKSRVHPKYKTKYHVGNWPEYERALVRRGDITLWLSADAIDA